MTTLSIRKIGDPVLRTKAREVEEITKKTIELLDNMANTMYKSSGIGLAAPQVGILQRLITVDVDHKKLYKLINPEIISEEGKAIMEEGCLSIPGEQGAVVRAKKVLIRALTQNNDEIEIKAEGLLARAFQHEIDHLNGVLFVDKVVDMEDFNKKNISEL